MRTELINPKHYARLQGVVNESGLPSTTVLRHAKGGRIRCAEFGDGSVVYHRADAKRYAKNRSGEPGRPSSTSR